MEPKPGENDELANSGSCAPSSDTLSDSVWAHWAEAFLETASTINQGPQPEYRSQYLLTRLLVLHRPTSSNTGMSIQGRQRSSHSEIAEEEDGDVECLTTIRAPAKKPALSSPGDPFLFCGSN